MQDEINKLIASVGAMAEMTALYRDELLKRNVSRQETIYYVNSFIRTVFAVSNGGGNSGQA